LATKKVAYKSIVATLLLWNVNWSTAEKYNKHRQGKQTSVLAFWQKWLGIYFLRVFLKLGSGADERIPYDATIV